MNHSDGNHSTKAALLAEVLAILPCALFLWPSAPLRLLWFVTWVGTLAFAFLSAARASREAEDTAPRVLAILLAKLWALTLVSIVVYGVADFFAMLRELH